MCIGCRHWHDTRINREVSLATHLRGNRACCDAYIDGGKTAFIIGNVCAILPTLRAEASKYNGKWLIRWISTNGTECELGNWNKERTAILAIKSIRGGHRLAML